MADTTIKLSGTYDSIEAYRILEEMREMSTDYEEIKEEAEAAVTTATAAATTAQGHANNASTYADNAQIYAGNANTSAGAAAGSASTASTAASNALSSETAAAGSASAASTSETNAAASATAAAASAAEAAATLDSYLPLSGGTMTGNIEWNKEDVRIYRKDENGQLSLYGGVSWSTSASLTLYGNKNGTNGDFNLSAHNGTTRKQLIGKSNGTLEWDGSNVITASTGVFTNAGITIGDATPSRGLFGPNGNNCFRIAAEKNGYSEAGANIQLYGKSATSNAGYFQVSARTDSSGLKTLEGTPSGSLKWNGQPVQTSSDKRLKTEFSDVPADVLEAWSKVEWKQFKYIADVKQKGDSCRFHTGLVAQDVHDVCGDEILKYGILCHDVQEATEEQGAVDLWTIRYEEALAMEVIYLRNEIKKLHEEIKALRTE